MTKYRIVTMLHNYILIDWIATAFFSQKNVGSNTEVLTPVQSNYYYC